MPHQSISPMVYFTSFAALLTGAVATWVPSGYAVGFILFFLAGLPLVVVPRWRVPLSCGDKTLLFTIVLFGAVWLAEVLWWGQPMRLYEKPVRFLAAAAGLLVLLTHPPKPAALWAGIAIGAWGALGLMGWEKLVLGLGRREGIINAIQLGGLAMLLALLCLAGMGWAVQKKHARRWVIFLASGCVAGVLASLWTGSRGAWLAMPVGLVIVYFVYRPWLSKGVVLGVVFCLTALLAAAIAIPQTGVQQRLAKAVHDVQMYAQDTTIQTSNGGRFEVWKASLWIIQERPWFGVGETGFAERIQEFARTGKVATYAQRFRHAHNEVLDVLAKRGVIGFASLLLLYAVPWRLFSRELKALSLAQRAYAAGGLLVVGMIATFGLTQAFIGGHNSGIMVYLVWVMLFYVLLTRPQSHVPPA